MCSTALLAIACSLVLACKKTESGEQAVTPSAPAPGEREQTEAGAPDIKASVNVELRLPVETFHIISPPSKPVEIVLENHGRAPVSLPVHYDGARIRLVGQGRHHPRQVVLFPVEPRPPAQEHVALEPGESRVVLSVFIGEILRLGYLRASGGPPSPVWRWDWPLRSAPPISPIHKMRTDGYAKAVFWVEVETGEETLYSDRVVLEVQDFHNPAAPHAEKPRPPRQRGSVRLGKLRVRGEAQPYLEKQLQRKKKELLECYQRGLEADPKLEGEVVLDFFFDKRGKPTTVAVSKSTIRDRHVVDCLQKTVGGWTLEGHGRGVRVLLPLILDPH